MCAGAETVGGKRALEPERTDADAAQRPSKRAKVVRFSEGVRTDSGPDLVSRILCQLLSDTIERRVSDLESLQRSILSSQESARFIVDAVYTDLLASESGRVLVQSLILTMIYKRLRALVNTIAARAADDGEGMLTLLPSHLRINHKFIPMLVKLQCAIHTIILGRCKPSHDDSPTTHPTATTTTPQGGASPTSTISTPPAMPSTTHPLDTAATLESAQSIHFFHARNVRASADANIMIMTPACM